MPVHGFFLGGRCVGTPLNLIVMRHDDVADVAADYRLMLARHYRALSKVSRSEIFEAADARYMPTNLLADAATMFAGYVGPGFVRHAGLIFLAINPGGGGDA